MAVFKVDIGGKTVGIVDLEEGFGAVRSLGLTGAEDLMEALLGKISEKNYIPSGMEDRYREALLVEYRIFTGEESRKPGPAAFPEIRLYGSSCFRCEKLDGMIRGILSRAGIRADYQLVQDLRELAGAGVMMTPAVAVNGRMVLQGQMPTDAQLEKIILGELEAGPPR